MRDYVSPTAELVTFNSESVLTAQSGSCQCFLEDQVVDDTMAEDSECYTDTEGADAFNLHGKVV